MRRTYIVITAVSAAMVLGGATALAVALRAGQDRGKPEPIAYAPAVSPSQPPIPPAAALAQTMRQMRGGAVVAARIGEAPADSRRGNLPWLYAAVRVPGMARGLDVEPIWEADLIEGVVADRAGTARDIRDDFGGSTFDAVLPDGSRIADASGGLGDIVRGQQFRGTETVSAKLSIERDDFIYADPPYDVEFTTYSAGGFSWDDQVRTAELLAKHLGPVLLSNQATKRVVDLYKELEFDLQFFAAPRRISCNGNRAAAREVLASRNL